ncbi:MAG TPA: hypothetical protein VN982_09220 [Candidatus Dormibacteraeota bacterium]|nr:hypothetical protein [Candidatus Dormibacteraeota bacterium]
MAASPTRVVLNLDADARLAAAAGGVARYFADAAGVEEEPCRELQMAVVAACKESFQNLKDGSAKLVVVLERLADRIEVALTHEGDAAPAVGLHAVAGFSGADTSGKQVFSGLDRMQFETMGSSTTTRLTKFWKRTATPQ